MRRKSLFGIVEPARCLFRQSGDNTARRFHLKALLPSVYSILNPDAPLTIWRASKRTRSPRGDGEGAGGSGRRKDGLVYDRSIQKTFSVQVYFATEVQRSLKEAGSGPNIWSEAKGRQTQKRHEASEREVPGHIQVRRSQRLKQFIYCILEVWSSGNKTLIDRSWDLNLSWPFGPGERGEKWNKMCQADRERLQIIKLGF